MPAIPEYFQRIGQKPKYPELWDGCIGAWAPCLGPTGARLFNLGSAGGTATAFTPANIANSWVVDDGAICLYTDTGAGAPGSQYQSTLTIPTSGFSYMSWGRSGTSGVSSHRLCGNGDNAAGLSGTSIIWGYSGTGVYVVNRLGANNATYDIQAGNGTVNVADARWHCITVTHSPGNEPVYIDGVLRGLGNIPAITSSYPWGIGMDSGGAFYGYVGTTHVWSRKLSDTEVYLLAQAQTIAYTTRNRRIFAMLPQLPTTSYFTNQYFPDDYFSKEYFPHEVVTIPRYFPATYFPNSYFPQRYFPHKLKTPIAAASFVDTPTLGGAAVTVGVAQIQPAGRASTAAFGAQQINRRIAGAGLNATQSFGTDSIRRLLALTSVAGAAQYGAHKLNRSISPSGLLDTQSFGTDIIRRYVTAAGVAAAQSFGTTSLCRQVAVTGRASTVAAGNAATAGGALSVICTGLSPVTGFGTTNIRRLIAAAGFATPQSLGTPAVRRRVTATGLAATQTFGADAIARRIYAAGLSATQSFGVAQIRYRITVPGVSPHAALGNAAIQGETQFLICSGVAVAEGFGTPAIPRRLNISALSGQSQTGVSSVSRKLLLPGVARTGNIGSVTVPRLLSVSGIATSNAIPQPQLRRRLQTVSLPSGVAFGQFRVRLFLLPAGFVDPPQVGQWSLQVRILPTGVLDVAEFGNPELDRYLAVYGFAVGATYGTLQLVGASAPGIYGDDVVQNIWQGAF